MADIWFDVDTALTEVPVNKVPLVASSDGFTIDETIAYNEAGMDLNWNFVTSAGVFTQTNVVPTTAGVHDWTHQGNGMYTIEVPASAGTVNNDTEGYGWFSGFATGVVPFTSPIYGFRAAAINDALCDGGDLLDVNTTQIGGTAAPETAGVLTVNTTQIEGSDATDQINAAVDVALNTAIPGTPTADSINERIKAIDDLTQAAGAGDLAAILADTGTDGVVLATDAVSAAALAADAATEIATALGNIVIEDDGPASDTSIRLVDALAYQLAVLIGVATGQGTATGVFKSAGGNENRVTGTTDTDANRSGIVLTPPS